MQEARYAQGYQGEAQSPQFRDSWFHPGDLGTLSADGWLTVTGREDDVINLGGLKLSSVDLETQWLHRPGVRDICEVVVGMGERQRLVVAAVLDAGCDHAALGEYIASTLPHGARFVVIRRTALPRTPWANSNARASRNRWRVCCRRRYGSCLVLRQKHNHPYPEPSVLCRGSDTRV